MQPAPNRVVTIARSAFGVRQQQPLNALGGRPLAERVAGDRQQAETVAEGQVPWQRGEVVGDQGGQLGPGRVGLAAHGERRGQDRPEDRQGREPAQERAERFGPLGEAALLVAHNVDDGLGEDRHTLVARALADRLPLGDQRLGLAEAAGQHGGRGRASGSCQR